MSSVRQRCGAHLSADGRMEWRVWAPYAKTVDLIVIDGAARRVEAMTAEPHGYFCFRGGSASHGQQYAYSLDKGPDRADPASRWQPNGVTQPSAIVLPSRFQWTDDRWEELRGTSSSSMKCMSEPSRLKERLMPSFPAFPHCGNSVSLLWS